MSDLIERLESESHLSQFDGYDALIATGKEAAARIRVLEDALRDALRGYVGTPAMRDGLRKALGDAS